MRVEWASGCGQEAGGAVERTALGMLMSGDLGRGDDVCRAHSDLAGEDWGFSECRQKACVYTRCLGLNERTEASQTSDRRKQAFGEICCDDNGSQRAMSSGQWGGRTGGPLMEP